MSDGLMGVGLTNWAGNHRFGAARVHRPDSVAQVQELVAGASRVGVVGSRHSFNAIADTPGDLLSMERLNRIVALDERKRTVTVEAGIRYGDLGRALQRAGYALHNLASLPHISVAGACSTATHGSGDRNGNLATAVTALELVTADGEVLTLSEEEDGGRFRGAVVGLGALGVVTRLTLRIEPAFEVRQYVYEDMPEAEVEAHFEEIIGSAYSVSLFTDWSGPRINQVWLKERVPGSGELPATLLGVETGPATGAVPATGAGVGAAIAGAETAAAAVSDVDRLNGTFFGARPARVKVHPLVTMSPEPCTEQLGIPGPWNERLTHFRLEFTPSSGDELQSEYFVPRRHGVAAFRALKGLSEQIVPLIQMGEIRSIAADDLWLSTAYGQDVVAFHFTWLPEWPPVAALLPAIEERLAPFGARPHWGKLFAMPAAKLRELYPKLPNFQALRRQLDPAGKLRNEFLDSYVPDEE